LYRGALFLACEAVIRFSARSAPRQRRDRASRGGNSVFRSLFHRRIPILSSFRRDNEDKSRQVMAKPQSKPVFLAENSDPQADQVRQGHDPASTLRFRHILRPDQSRSSPTARPAAGRCTRADLPLGSRSHTAAAPLAGQPWSRDCGTHYRPDPHPTCQSWRLIHAPNRLVTGPPL